MSYETLSLILQSLQAVIALATLITALMKV